jgi:hypothetical protein
MDQTNNWDNLEDEIMSLESSIENDLRIWWGEEGDSGPDPVVKICGDVKDCCPEYAATKEAFAIAIEYHTLDEILPKKLTVDGLNFKT